ncbi:MAG: hypothetical protein IH596_07135 [Bacteroidales bacterium]|nr:hypothetical protein [Bacteroidales bacterium]
MIDFIKFTLENEDWRKFTEHPDFFGKFHPPRSSRKTRILKIDQEAVFNGITVRLIHDPETGKKDVKIEFSIHKYANFGHNYDDLSFQRLCLSLESFSARYDIDLSMAVIHYIEFGVNLTIPYDPLKIIECFINHKNKPFRPEYGGKELDMWKCKKGNYVIKFYNKRKLSPLLVDRLRYELQIKKMVHIKSVGIRTLADLMNKKKIRLLGRFLWNTFSEILMSSPYIDMGKLSKEEIKFLKVGKKNSYWVNAKNQDRNNQLYQKMKFRKLVTANSSPDLQSNLEKKIRVKWKYLLYYSGQDKLLKTLNIDM